MGISRISIWMTAGIVLLFVCMVSFRAVFTGTAGGSVNPPEAGLRAFLFSGKDTLSVNVANGNFQFTKVPSGTYQLLIEVTPPYRNAVKDGIRVLEGEFTNVGQIELSKN